MGLDEKRIVALTMQVSDCLRKENEAPDHRVMVMALEGWAVLQKESLGKFIAMAATANRLHSAVCQGGDRTQTQQSTIGGHKRQAKHFCCGGQKAIRRIRMLKR